MDLFGLHPDSVLARVRKESVPSRLPTLAQSLIAGGLGFFLVSAFVFGTVAYAERMLYANLGKVGAYGFWTFLFVFGSGFSLGRLVIGPGGLSRFYGFFATAFFLYALIWTTAWMVIGGLPGEVVGTLGAGLALGLMFLTGFDVKKAGAGVVFVILLGSTAGYFLGRVVWVTVPGKAGMLGWGFVYGLCFGPALACAVYLSQLAIRDAIAHQDPIETPPPSSPPSPSDRPSQSQTL